MNTWGERLWKTKNNVLGLAIKDGYPLSSTWPHLNRDSEKD